MSERKERLYTVGELARLCGITVRTLQFYDGSGLLTPGYHSEGGRRLYSGNDVSRLQQILFLKSFGLPLEEIRSKLQTIRDPRDFIGVLGEQKAAIAGQIDRLHVAVGTIDLAIHQIEASGDLPVEQLFKILDLMRIGVKSAYVLKYFRAEEVDRLLQPFETGADVGQGAMMGLMEELQRLHSAGVDPRSAQGVDFAARWMQAVNALTGGDPAMLQSALSAGHDVGNWPDELPMKAAIQGFLGPAMDEWTKQMEGGNGNG